MDFRQNNFPKPNPSALFGTQRGASVATACVNRQVIDGGGNAYEGYVIVDGVETPSKIDERPGFA
jgi:hypothetical protein